MPISPLEQRVSDIIQPSLEDMGYELVQVKMSETAKRPVLAIMAERKDDKNMTVDDCADISHRNFRVLQPDPHRFDGDKDGIGCEEPR